LEKRENHNRLPGEIYSEKIREARLARGYSVTDLAEKIGISRVTITKYESGLVSPGIAILQKYAEFLDFSPLFFTIPNFKKESLNSPVLFRAQAKVSAADKEMIVIRGKWLGRVCNHLEQSVSFPEVEIPTNYARTTPFAPDEIENIAETLRKLWGLGSGPILNMTVLLQDKGALVARIPANMKKADACSFWRGGRPYFLLFSDKASAVRSRFDAAHELGHLVLHKISEGDEKKRFIVSRLDEEANRFAGAFLLPQQSIAREVISTSLEHFVALKRRWLVAIAAMVYRCQDLKLLSESQIAYLWRQRTIQGWRYKEPLDDVFPIEKPTMINDAVNLLIDNRCLTLPQLKDHFEYPDEDLEAICGLLPGSFTKNENKAAKPHLYIVS